MCCSFRQWIKKASYLPAAVMKCTRLTLSRWWIPQFPRKSKTHSTPTRSSTGTNRLEIGETHQWHRWSWCRIVVLPLQLSWQLSILQLEYSLMTRRLARFSIEARWLAKVLTLNPSSSWWRIWARGSAIFIRVPEHGRSWIRLVRSRLSQNHPWLQRGSEVPKRERRSRRMKVAPHPAIESTLESCYLHLNLHRPMPSMIGPVLDSSLLKGHQRIAKYLWDCLGSPWMMLTILRENSSQSWSRNTSRNKSLAKGTKWHQIVTTGSWRHCLGIWFAVNATLIP